MSSPVSQPMHTAQAPNSNPAWKSFWSTGAVDTFGSTVEAVLAPDSDASPPLVAHWRQWLRVLPLPGEVLDIGTGNGVVLSHLLGARSEPGWRGIGIDLEEPNVEWLRNAHALQDGRLEVRGQVSAESLPFESERFSAVTSQFGVEYADLRRAVPEVIRTLRPGGSLGWVVHHAAGRPACLAKEELAHLAWLEQQGWLDTVARAIKVLGAPVRSLPGAGNITHDHDIRSELDRMGHALRTRATSSPCPDVLMDLGGLTVHCIRLSQRDQAAAATEQVSKFRSALSENRARLEDLVAHALDEAAWLTLQSEVRAQGVDIRADTGPLHDRGHLMGWWLHGTRA